MRKLQTKELLIASHNKGKLNEFTLLLEPFGIRVRGAAELGLVEPEETGTSFEENAFIKAMMAAQATGLVSLADDSGLCVEALDGDPGIYTADWAIQDDGRRDFTIAMVRLERALQQKSALLPKERHAYFICVLCLAWPDGEAQYFHGKVEGHIHNAPSGASGFGYDPIFIPSGFDRTFAQMSAQEKNRIGQDGQPLSHRARALKLFTNALLKA